jgi:Icc protein
LILKTLLYITLLSTALFLTSCDDLFQYNPNQILLDKDERNLTSGNLQRILATPAQDTVKFIVMGDSQRWYDESADFVKSANQQKNISFVVHTGDISDFGLTQEFKWVNEIMSGLKYPYLTVIGNHDLIANGPKIYRKMYGELDYSFEYGENKFIFINTNSREYAFDGSTPNLPWLRTQLLNNDKNAIVIAHVPPFDQDFDQELAKEYRKILADDPNVRFTFYGHQHTFKDTFHYEDGVRYYITTSMGARGYLVVTTWNGGHQVERIEF